MLRRRLLCWLGWGLLGSSGRAFAAVTGAASAGASGESVKPVTLFVCGDVMTGRGIDQVLPTPSSPEIYEPYMTSARGYVRLAEELNGPIPAPVAFDYIWGDALPELERLAPDLRIINLETAVTRSDSYWPHKGINYRMHPDNMPCIRAAGIDACVLANNHVIDWGYDGLGETLATLAAAGIRSAGAGADIESAGAPLLFDLGSGRRVILLALAHTSSGVPAQWRAAPARAGVYLIDALSDRAVNEVAERVRAVKQRGDLVVVSVHWGGNWGYDIPRGQQRFAHGLIDHAAVDVVHGHSSHHPRGIEVYHERPILYGCGDFLNDYEGIRGHEGFRGDLVLMYFVTLEPRSGSLLRLHMTPLQIRKFQLRRPVKSDRQWLTRTMARECRRLGTDVNRGEAGRLELSWSS
jgi:poly-gamma-glutamate capsule biosynthesis protein CapA/YwtB (metallophosphatase superfamily)